MIKPIHLLACVLCLLPIVDVFAAGAGSRTEEILAHQRSLRADLDAGKAPFDMMSRGRKQAILSDQKKLATLLEGTTDATELGPRDRESVAVLLARIEASLGNADEDRVCTQEARTGSNFMTRVCRTPAEIRAQHESSGRMLEEERARMKCTDANGCM
jgi:hypothetical protein